MTQNPQMWLATGLSVVVVAFLLREVQWLIRGRASADWPTVEGTIVRAEVERFEHRPKEYGNPEIGYSFRVTYEYTVAGKTYQSEVLDCGRSTKREMPPNSAANATDAIGYAQGDTIDVYHDPHNPSVAVLAPGVQPATMRRIVFLLFADVVVVALGIASLS